MPVSDVQSAMQGVLIGAIAELVIVTPISSCIILFCCWLYNRLVVGTYDKAGIFGTPLPFDDDLYTANVRTRKIKVIDPNAVPMPSWGTAVTVAFCAKFVQTVVAVGIIYFSLSNAAQLGPPKPDLLKIFAVAGLVAAPVSFISLCYLLSTFLPTNLNRGMALGVLHFVISVLTSATLILIVALFVPIFSVAGGAR